MTTETGLEDDYQTEGTYYYNTSVGQSPSEAVIQAVASASGRNPTPLADTAGDEEGALDPLYETINPDAFDRLFDSATETNRPSATVEFRYCGYNVTVDSSGQVTVTKK